MKNVETKPSTSAIRMPEQPTSIDVFYGYEGKDLSVFDQFQGANPQAKAGYVTDFLGTRTRTTSLWNEVRYLDGRVMGIPVPHDIFETIEWLGLLQSVATARRDKFSAMELGAGHGPWIVAAGVAARFKEIGTIRLCGVEADPGRYALMQQHLIDNDFVLDDHHLVCAAVGVEAGKARWPKIGDPANNAGARPIKVKRNLLGTTLNREDIAYMRASDEDMVDVEVRSFGTLLRLEPTWDLIHCDVQGWETAICRAELRLLSERVRWMVIGTHSRKIDGDLVELMFQAGWMLEHEKPSRFVFDPSKSSLEAMTTIDGTQVWRNPRFCND